MTVRDDIFTALHDAIGWQAGLADAWARGTPERIEALAQIRRYKKILKRRYGSSTTAIDGLIACTPTLGLDDLRKLRAR